MRVLRRTLFILLVLSGVARAQTQTSLLATYCASCSNVVIRGPTGVQQTTAGGSVITAIAVTWSTSAVRTIEIFDAGALPPNGAVSPYYCYVVTGAAGPALGTVTLDWNVHPLRTLHGCVIALSTDPGGCSNLTLDGNTNRIDMQVISP